jgi:hypothetical protein
MTEPRLSSSKWARILGGLLAERGELSSGKVRDLLTQRTDTKSTRSWLAFGWAAGLQVSCVK